MNIRFVIKKILISSLIFLLLDIKVVKADIVDYRSIFNAEYYKNKYPELNILYGNDTEALYNHFLFFGIKEGRSPSSEFVLEYYIHNNKDLKNSFKDNNEKYYEHYVTRGKLEGRVADRILPDNEIISTSSNLISNNNKPLTKEEINKIANDYLILINGDNPISTKYQPPVAKITGGQYMHVAVAPIVEQIIEDAKAEGLTLRVLSGYRSAERQEFLFNRRVITYIASGQEPANAFNLAAMTNPLPGTSEHQSGLCMDIVEAPHTSLVYELDETEGYKWMLKHCAEYGFILRYPKGKSEITSIIYEPWHFRYVGIEAATQIMKNDMTLEEYTEKYIKNK